MLNGPPTQSLILIAGSMARFANNAPHVLPRICVASRLPSQQFTVSPVQESLELPGVVEGLNSSIAPLTAPFVVAVVKRNEPPDAVIVRVHRCHKPTVDPQKAAGRAVARRAAAGVPPIGADLLRR